MYLFKSSYKDLLNDKTPPVLVFLKLRDIFPGTLLLEAASFHLLLQQNNFSIICIDAVAEIIMDIDYIYYLYPDDCEEKISFTNKKRNGCGILEEFMKHFYSRTQFLKGFSGFYGYISYNSVPLFDKIFLRATVKDPSHIPKLRLGFFRTLILFDHFNNVLTIYLHLFTRNDNSYILKIISLIYNKKLIHFPFRIRKKLSSNITDDEYKKSVRKSIRACRQGNVFQIVPSKQYQQEFKGDDFNVYRALRSLNPSPNLFYFDYGHYKIFGSSPEYHFTIKNRTAYIFPIAGTILRSGDDLRDKMLAEELSKNTKENAEHIMLIDLARNDLSISSLYVKVERYKDIKSFSHVLHLQSEVSGKLPIHYSPVNIFAETFPAGTLSGTPKYKAMELLDEFENQDRGLYGGSIGFFSLDGSVKTAIIIRAFLSKGNMLFMQAGAGVVASSTEANELHEVNNKLKALNQSIIAAENIILYEEKNFCIG